MRFWFQPSRKNKKAFFVAAEHKDVSAFAEVRADRRKILRAAIALGGLALRRKLKGKRGRPGERKAVEREKKRLAKMKRH